MIAPETQDECKSMFCEFCIHFDKMSKGKVATTWGIICQKLKMTQEKSYQYYQICFNFHKEEDCDNT